MTNTLKWFIITNIAHIYKNYCVNIFFFYTKIVYILEITNIYNFFIVIGFTLNFEQKSEKLCFK